MTRSFQGSLLLTLAPLVVTTGCASVSTVADYQTLPRRTFQTGFEALEDFAGFYLTPQGHLGTTRHELFAGQVRSGSFAHKAWIEGRNPESTLFVNNNHRGYPTIQLHKRPGGGFRTPCRIEWWVWLDMTLMPGEWFSFATFSPDASDAWKRTVLVNLSDQGVVHLMHVPKQGQGNRSFQTSKPLPMRTWVKLTTELTFGSMGGEASVWQDDQLVSKAAIEPTNPLLEQAHFGLYAPPSVATGTVYNDDLIIQEL